MAEKKQETILRHLQNLQALNREIRAALDRQQKDEALSEQGEAAGLVKRIDEALALQGERLEKRIDDLGGTGVAGELKERLARVMGMVEGLWQDLRDEPVSHALRDDYTALNLAAAHYTMLHAAGRALDDRMTADMAYQNLRELTPLVVEISQVLPLVVVAEMGKSHEGIDLAAATGAVEATHAAWQPETAETG